jgi:methionyl aminopeptidase
MLVDDRFQVVRTYCGHGIGELFHCSPNIPHYSNNKAVGVMKEGHVFTGKAIFYIASLVITQKGSGTVAARTSERGESNIFQHLSLPGVFDKARLPVD